MFFAGENFKLLPFSLENKPLPDGSHKTQDNNLNKAYL
jgi:hypothetical protein